MPEPQDIISKLKQKDEKAFEQVFRMYYAELCRFAMKYVPDESAAEELVQDAFCTIWSKLDRLVIQTSLKSYLYSSIRNAAFNAIKHQTVVDTHVQYHLARSSEGDQVNQLEIRELELHIQVAIEKLPERCKEVFKLSRFEDKKYSEIANEMNISVKTVEAQMGKALKMMRAELGSYLPIGLLMWFEIFFKG